MDTCLKERDPVPARTRFQGPDGRVPWRRNNQKERLTCIFPWRIGAGDWFCPHILPGYPDRRARLHTGKNVMGKSGKGGFMQGGIRACGFFSPLVTAAKGTP